VLLATPLVYGSNRPRRHGGDILGYSMKSCWSSRAWHQSGWAHVTSHEALIRVGENPSPPVTRTTNPALPNGSVAL
jgi:hypothetical protein